MEPIPFQAPQICVRIHVYDYPSHANQLTSISKKITASISIGLLFDIDPGYGGWREAAKLAIEDLNAAAVAPGFKFRTVFESAPDATTSLTGAIALANRGVVGVVGAERSSFAIAVQYYLGALGVPLVSPSATSDSLSDKSQYPTFTRTLPADRYQGVALASLVSHFGWKCAVITHYQEEYASNSTSIWTRRTRYSKSSLANVPCGANAVAAQFIVLSEQKNISVTRVAYRTDATDFSATISAIRAAQCNIIVAVLDNERYEVLMSQAKTAGIFGNPQYQWILTEIMLEELVDVELAERNLTTTDFDVRVIQ
jgi:ABC-type branched-subunit amino acid transport system substrate-binding protein